MPTVIHELADAFLRRKQALAERGQAKTKLAGSDYFMPKSAKQDLANRLSVFEQGGLPELLKQGASEMYHNPIVNTAISLTPGAGDVQSGYEAVQSAKEGNWGEAGLNALGVLPFIPSMGMIGKTVWHGSPHSFNAFDLSKVGTGEGAQVYGHGLYLAEHPEVAAGYQKRLSDASSPYSYEWRGQTYEKGSAKDPIAHAIGLTYHQNASTAKSIAKQGLKDAKAGEPYALDMGGEQYYQTMLDTVNQLRKKDIKATQGALYKVDLPDEHIAKMLDWHEPISEEMRKPISNAMMEKFGSGLSMGSGEQAYKQLVSEFKFAGSQNPAKDASEFLYQQGVPGIKYFDAGSRKAKEGTQNYVVFSDQLPQILERNGTSVFEFPKEEIINVPISQIEHGESAMPGGKLTWPGSKDLIKQYAEMPTEIPAIRAIPPDADNPFWMIEDGSHRYEAAKLRGMKEIPVIVEK